MILLITYCVFCYFFMMGMLITRYDDGEEIFDFFTIFGFIFSPLFVPLVLGSVFYEKWFI